MVGSLHAEQQRGLADPAEPAGVTRIFTEDEDDGAPQGLLLSTIAIHRKTDTGRKKEPTAGESCNIRTGQM